MNVAELLRAVEENLAYDAAEEAEEKRRDEDRAKRGPLKKVILDSLPCTPTCDFQCLCFALALALVLVRFSVE